MQAGQRKALCTQRGVPTKPRVNFAEKQGIGAGPVTRRGLAGRTDHAPLRRHRPVVLRQQHGPASLTGTWPGFADRHVGLLPAHGRQQRDRSAILQFQAGLEACPT